MQVIQLIKREIRFRRTGFALGLIAVAVAVGGLVIARSFLFRHDTQSRRLVAELQERSTSRMDALRNDARVFSKNLGFNILLLPAGQDIGLFYTRDCSTHFFARSEVDRLRKIAPSTLNHLLPILRGRLDWDLYGDEVVVMGVEGEIYIKQPRFQKPIEEAILSGTIHVGHAIAARLNLTPGEKVSLKGIEFKVKRIMEQKGNIDDVSILMDLGDAQLILNQPERIGGILALSCNCVAGDIEPISAEVDRAMPGVQVVEFSVRARARQRARQAINKRTHAEMEDIKGSRMALRQQLAAFTMVSGSLTSTIALLLLVVLAVSNSRERKVEVAMLRALGLRSGRILILFLAKAMIIGLVGGIAGVIIGVLVAQILNGMAGLSALYIIALVLGAALVTTIACAPPAFLAAKRDPAEILNGE